MWVTSATLRSSASFAPCRQGTASVSHGGSIPMKPAKRMVGTSATSGTLTSGGSPTHSFLTHLNRTWHRVRDEVRALETANLLPGAIFASEMIPVAGPIQQRLVMRHQ
jgi:hypothetical protein